MKCGCGAYAWTELDRELNLMDLVCISGHRVTLAEPLPIPETKGSRVRRLPSSVERIK